MKIYNDDHQLNKRIFNDMMKARKNFTTSLEFDVAEDFTNISLELGKKPAALIREFIIATVENRIKLTPPRRVDDKFYNDFENHNNCKSKEPR